MSFRPKMVRSIIVVEKSPGRGQTSLWAEMHIDSVSNPKDTVCHLKSCSKYLTIFKMASAIAVESAKRYRCKCQFVIICCCDLLTKHIVKASLAGRGQSKLWAEMHIDSASINGRVYGKKYYVYIMTNKTNDVLYIGVTNDIVRRKWEHQNHTIKGFSSKYNLEKCVYVEECGDIIDAIRREKQLKHWNRGKKYCLVKTINPEWNDLIVFDDKG